MKKNNLFKTVFVLIALANFSIYQIQAQTHGSGTITNGSGCSTARDGGLAGNTSIGCNAGSTGMITNGDNTCIGESTGSSLTSGGDNTFLGFKAGNSNTTGASNTFVGSSAGSSNTTGIGNICIGNAGYTNATSDGNICIGNDAGGNNTAAYNIFIGSKCASHNTSGVYNTYLGNFSGSQNLTGSDNTLMGYNAGTNNTASYNTYMGYLSGYTNTTGTNNVSIGDSSGYSNTANFDVFIGSRAGRSTTSGYHNTMIGYLAGNHNSTADYNTYIGSVAGIYSTGDWNTFVGSDAGYNNSSGNKNTFIGHHAGFYTNITGTGNTFLGYYADENGDYSNATAIGNGAIVSASNTVWIGNSSITNVYCQPEAWGSDRRFKKNIKENVKGLDFINKLRAVTYQMDTKALDDFMIQNMPDSVKAMHQAGMDFAPSTAIVHSGFIAQEVEQAAKDVNFKSSIIVTPADSSSNIYALSYAEIVVPLVKAVQELSKAQDSLMAVINTLTESNKSMQIPNGGRGYTEANTQQVELTNNDAILYQNIPNPFGSETTINYYLPESIKTAKMVFYDETGRVIKEVELNERGNGSVIINSENLRSGIYSYSMVVNEKVMDTKKMQRVK